MTPLTHPTPDDEISLLDILVVLAENFWLLVLAPLVIGALAFGVASFLPKTYESTAILHPRITFDEFGNQEGGTAGKMQARLNSPDVQIQAAESQVWIQQLKLSDQELMFFLQDAILVRSDQKNGLITVKCKAPSAVDAQAFLRALISSYVQSVSPNDRAKEDIYQKIQTSRKALEVINPAITSILSKNPETGEVRTSITTQPSSRPALADLVAQRTALELRISELLSRLNVMMEDIVVQAPTLDDKPVSPKRLQTTAVAVILSGLVLVFFVFIRAALRSAAQDPEGAEKITRIRKGILRR